MFLEGTGAEGHCAVRTDSCFYMVQDYRYLLQYAVGIYDGVVENRVS